jgi:ABC-type multidrug transport system fused ATPase/permease subunit
MKPEPGGGAGPLFVRLVREHAEPPGPLAAAVVSMAGLGVARLWLTWLVKATIEGPVASGDRAGLAAALAGAAAVLGVTAALIVTSRQLLARVRERTAARLRERAVSAVLRADLRDRLRLRDGDVVGRIVDDVAGLGGFLTQVLKRYVGDGAVVLGGTVLAFALSWRLAALVVVAVPLVGLLVSRASRSLRQSGHDAQAGLGDFAATFAEQLHGLATIKSLQAEAAEVDRLARVSAAQRRARVRGETVSALGASAVWLVTGLVSLVVLTVGAREIAAGRITPGGLLAFGLLAGQVLEPLRRLGEAHAHLLVSLGAAVRVFELLDLAPESWPDGRPAPDRPTGPAAVRFDGLSYSYGGRPVLQGFDLQVAAGERLAVVGATGSGKSTLGRLLAGFLVADSGRVEVGGRDVRALPLPLLRREVCVVEQEPFVFEGSLHDNVAYGALRDAPAGVVDDALHAVGLDAVASLRASDGAGDSGRDLSVGQRQRVALARAVARAPRVLVLDEATSALDGEAEQTIFRTLEAFLGQRTVIVFSHRLATVAACDRVAVLEGGRVRTVDRPSALLARDEGFAALFSGQA